MNSNNQIKMKYFPTIKFQNSIPNIPVECKHIKTEISLNDFEKYETIQMEETMMLGLSESETYGMNIEMSLPEFNYVPSIEQNQIFEDDKELFGLKNE